MYCYLKLKLFEIQLKYFSKCKSNNIYKIKQYIIKKIVYVLVYMFIVCAVQYWYNNNNNNNNLI
jgi:hypothetical protein